MKVTSKFTLYFMIFFSLILIGSFLFNKSSYKIEKCDNFNNCKGVNVQLDYPLYKGMLEMEFQGVIRRKFIECVRNTITFDLIDNGIEYQEGFQNNYSCLFKNSEPGDSIIKNKGVNYFLLVKKNGFKIVFSFECGLCCGCEDTDRNGNPR